MLAGAAGASIASITGEQEQTPNAAAARSYMLPLRTHGGEYYAAEDGLGGLFSSMRCGTYENWGRPPSTRSEPLSALSLLELPFCWLLGTNVCFHFLSKR